MIRVPDILSRGLHEKNTFFGGKILSNLLQEIQTVICISRCTDTVINLVEALLTHILSSVYTIVAHQV